MTTYSTRTAELGNITFTAPYARDDRDGYVWLEMANGSRDQICYGGDFRGNTVTSTALSLKADAQAWLRQRRNWLKTA